MTLDEARAIAVKLLRPFGVTDKHRVEGYAQVFARDLRDSDLLNEAVGTVLREHTGGFPPAPGAVVTAYREARHRRAADTPALPEPQLTEEQRAANIERMRKLQAMVAGELDMEGVLDDTVSVVRPREEPVAEDVRVPRRPGKAAS